MRISWSLKFISTSSFEALKVRDDRLEPVPHYSYYKKIRKDSNHRHIPNTQEAPKEIFQAVVALIIL